MCGVQLQAHTTDFDHKVPLAADSTGQYAAQLNHESDYQALCLNCDRAKCLEERRVGFCIRYDDEAISC